jgi:hypothetical protein
MVTNWMINIWGCKIVVEKRGKGYHLDDPGLDGMIKSKRILKDWDWGWE